MRVTLILAMVFGPLAVMASNAKGDLKAAHPGSAVTPGSNRGGKRQSNNLLRARDDVSARFQSVRAPLTSSSTSISHRIQLCEDPNYVLTCPLSDNPCCDPNYPVCTPIPLVL